jgi:HD superfamily phosphodiesterase
MDVRALCCLLKNADCIDPIKEKREEIVELILKTGNMAGYDQKNRFHCYDLWAHSLHTVCGLPRGLEDDMLYLAALLHDIGKPDCCMPGEYEGKPICIITDIPD